MKQGNQDVKSQILEATDKLLAQKGYRGMTVEDLAREVGIGKGTVYLHFQSKEDIALAHIGNIIERLTDKLSEIAQSQLSPEEKIKQILITRVTHRYESIQEYHLSLSDLFADLHSKVNEYRKRSFIEEGAIIASVIKEGQANGVFRNGDPHAFAAHFVTSTNSLMPLYLVLSEIGDRENLVKNAASIGEFLLDAIRTARPNAANNS